MFPVADVASFPIEAELHFPSRGSHSPPTAALARIRIRRSKSGDSFPEENLAPGGRHPAAHEAVDFGTIQIARTTSASSIDSQKRSRDVFKVDTDSDSDTDSEESGDTAERERRRRRRRRRRGTAEPSSKRLPRHVVKVLKRWLMSPEHYDYPYPDEENKARLIEVTGISVKQLNTWFTNARKRIWAPRRKKRGEPIPEFLPEVPKAVASSSRSRDVLTGPAPGPALRHSGAHHPAAPEHTEGTSAGKTQHHAGVVLDALSLLSMQARALDDEDISDPFVNVVPGIDSPLMTAAKPPLIPSGCPPRISAPAPKPLLIGIPRPPPPIPSGSLEMLAQIGELSPFSISGAASLTLPTPDALLEGGVDDCLSEEDVVPQDEELGPATLGSLASDDSSSLVVDAQGRFSMRLRSQSGPSESEFVLESPLFQVELTPSVLARFNRQAMPRF